MTTDMHLNLETGKANSALYAINVRGYDVPDAITQAHACQRALEAILTQQPTIEQLTTDPAKLKTSLAKIAADSRAHLDLQTAAEKARGPIATRILTATRAAVPGWIKNLQTDFDATWQDFRAVWVSAPIALDGYSTDEQAAAHAQLLRATSQLDQILSIRAVLGTLLHEDGADPRSVLLAAELPTVPARSDAIEQRWAPLGNLIDTWAGGGVLLTTGTRQPAAGIEKWDALATVEGLTISLADIDQLEARTRRRDEWSEAMTTVRSLGGMPTNDGHMWRDLVG